MNRGHQGRRRHARRAAPHRAAADAHPPEGGATRGLTRVADWLGPRRGDWRRINGHMVEIDAAPEDKIALLRRATREGLRRSRISTWCRRRWTISTPISCGAGGGAMKNVLIVARKEIQEGLRNRWVLATTLLLAALALTLTFLGSAPTGQRRRPRARRGDRQPVQPDDLPAAADRAADLARRHRRRDGARHHAAAAELSGRRAGRCCSASSSAIWRSSPSRRCSATARPPARSLLTGAAIDAESWTAFASMIGSSVLLGAVFIAIGYLVSALVARARHGRRHRHRHLAALRPDLRHGAARRSSSSTRAGSCRAAS